MRSSARPWCGCWRPQGSRPSRPPAATTHSRIAASDTPDAVILGVCLDGGHGFVVCRELRDRFGQDLPIVLVSGVHVDAHDLVAGLLIGADDYLIKPVDPDELIARIKRELARTKGRNAPGTGRGHTSGVTEYKRLNGLTPRELQVLRLLALGRSSTGIAHELVISHKTVSTHIQHVLAKLGVSSRAQAVARAYEDGLMAQEADLQAHGPLGDTAELPVMPVG